MALLRIANKLGWRDAPWVMQSVMRRHMHHHPASACKALLIISIIAAMIARVRGFKLVACQAT